VTAFLQKFDFPFACLYHTLHLEEEENNLYDQNFFFYLFHIILERQIAN